MTTGLANFVGTGPGMKPSRCLVYVLNDANGKFAVYGASWDTSIHARAKASGPYRAPLGLITTGDTRQEDAVR
jgi:hypothetical protein